MIIGIDASRISFRKRTGVEKYSAQLLYWFKKLDAAYYPDGGKYHNKYLLYTMDDGVSEFKDLPKNFHIRKIKARFFWTQLRLARHLLFDKEKPDLFFAPSNTIPFFLFLFDRKIKKVATVHDIAYRYFPASYSFISRLHLGLSVYFSVKFSDRIITISETTKKDLVNFYKADPKKIRVVPLGFDKPTFDVASYPEGTGEGIRSKFGIEGKYLLYIGRVESKKNVLNLVKAYYEILTRGYDFQLVLAGAKGNQSDDILEFIKKNNLQGKVILTDYISETEKNFLLSGASFFVFLPLYEGFGLPVLEAFYFDIPVISSRIPVFEELYSGAVLMTDQYNHLEISSNIIDLIKDRRKQESLKKKGREVLEKYGWEKCAMDTIQVLESLEK